MLGWRRDCNVHISVFIDYECCVGCPSVGRSQHCREDHGFSRMEGAGRDVGVLQAFQHTAAVSCFIDGLGITFWKTDRELHLPKETFSPHVRGKLSELLELPGSLRTWANEVHFTPHTKGCARAPAAEPREPGLLQSLPELS